MERFKEPLQGARAMRGLRRRRERRRALAAAGLTTAGIAAMAAVGIWMEAREAAAREAAASAPRALAVLPFRPVVPDPNTSYLGLGLAEAVIGRLSAVEGLTVRPLSAALAVAAPDAEPAEAGRALGAGAVLWGEYEKEGDVLNVRVHLVDAATGGTLPGRDLSLRTSDVAEIEETVAEQTLAALVPGAGARVRDLAGHGRQAEPRAHYLYLMARGKLATLESSAVTEAMSLLEEAVRADPSYARAHAALAEASASMFLGGLSDRATWLDRALAAGRRAVHLDDQDPEAHYALGYALLAAGDPVEAARASLRALRLDAGHPLALRQLALLLAASGAPVPAARLRDEARRQDPLIELGWVDLWITVAEGRAAALVPLLQEDAKRRRSAGRSPEQPIMLLGYLAFLTGDAGSGLRWAAMLEGVSSNVPFTDMVRLLAHARTGDAAAVERIVLQHQQAYWRDWEYCAHVGQAMALVGRREAAIDWLQRSVALGNCTVEVFNSGDALDGLRTDPRFHRILQTVRGRAAAIVEMARFAGYR